MENTVVQVCNKVWHCVETPSVFKEIALPRYAKDWKERDFQAYRRLEDLADAYNTSITVSARRRG
jgi:hypothetical protein